MKKNSGSENGRGVSGKGLAGIGFMVTGALLLMTTYIVAAIEGTYMTEWYNEVGRTASVIAQTTELGAMLGFGLFFTGMGIVLAIIGMFKD